MRILVTGGTGMLGKTICRVFSGKHDIIPVDHELCNVTDLDSVCTSISGICPDVVIHCAAMTAVDQCEAESGKAFAVNARGSENVATVCQHNNIRLVAISTDYVFSGDLDRPYRESDTATGGLTVYGQSKLAGEEKIRACCENHCICRTAWLYGHGGPSFVHTMMRLAGENHPYLSVVNDQIGNPTSTDAVARKLLEIVDRPDVKGTLHLTCEGEATWYGFAREIFSCAGLDQTLVACTTQEFPRPAPRPHNSRLEKLRLRELGLDPMPDWRAALAEFMEQEYRIKSK